MVLSLFWVILQLLEKCDNLVSRCETLQTDPCGEDLIGPPLLLYPIAHIRHQKRLNSNREKERAWLYTARYLMRVMICDDILHARPAMVLVFCLFLVKYTAGRRCRVAVCGLKLWLVYCSPQIQKWSTFHNHYLRSLECVVNSMPGPFGTASAPSGWMPQVSVSAAPVVLRRERFLAWPPVNLQGLYHTLPTEFQQRQHTQPHLMWTLYSSPCLLFPYIFLSDKTGSFSSNSA